MKRLLLSLLLMMSCVPARAIDAGSAAPGFTLPSARQGKRSLESLRGRVVLVNFWASWCGPCQQELPELNALAQSFSKQGLSVVAINVDEKSAAARAALKRLRLETPALEVLWDPQSKIVERYNPATMPSSYLIDRRGMVRFVHTGFKSEDPAAWRQEVQALLAEKPAPRRR